jgi:hypothetical protein
LGLPEVRIKAKKKGVHSRAHLSDFLEFLGHWDGVFVPVLFSFCNFFKILKFKQKILFTKLLLHGIILFSFFIFYYKKTVNNKYEKFSESILK